MSRNAKLPRFNESEQPLQTSIYRERIDPLPRIKLCKMQAEVCLGVAPIERLGSIGRVIPQSARVPFSLSRFRSAAVTVGETFKLALDALRAHKLRSFLTLL